MEQILQNLAIGIGVALQPINLMWVTLGGVLGTIIGMLPGIGPASGVALLLPLTFKMGPVGALITMAGVYYGAMYGGSRSSILINTPGDGAAIAACWDGYPLATKKKRPEAALAISAIASFLGGMIATIFMVLLSAPLAKLAIKFGPAQYLMLYLFALSATASMSGEGKVLKGFVSMFLGLMIATVGIDALSGVHRFTFGLMELQGGIDFLIAIIGIYALGEVFESLKEIGKGKTKIQKKFGRIWITREDWRRIWPGILRSTPLGFVIGVLPGTGATMASIMAYNQEKNLSKNKEEFGEGAVEGLAAPEAANNAASVGALIPMMTLGVPGSGTTAIMLGALMMLGLQPGPLLFERTPQIAWGVIASMFVGNLVLAVVNIPLAGVLVRILSIPERILYPLILGLAFLGTYSISNMTFDFFIVIAFGLLGLFMKRTGFPTSPMVLGAIVGGAIEEKFRQALTISNGSYAVFVSDPITIVLAILTVGSFLLPIIQRRKKAAGGMAGA
ncbi:MAG: tripartite tricarboxylate transporter permease [Rectinemataceae bacterium]|nr:tripartite tricarboxylate transporter permease [Spirochaetaceae bacterium]